MHLTCMQQRNSSIDNVININANAQPNGRLVVVEPRRLPANSKGLDNSNLDTGSQLTIPSPSTPMPTAMAAMVVGPNADSVGVDNNSSINTGSGNEQLSSTPLHQTPMPGLFVIAPLMSALAMTSSASTPQPSKPTPIRPCLWIRKRLHRQAAVTTSCSSTPMRIWPRRHPRIPVQLIPTLMLAPERCRLNNAMPTPGGGGVAPRSQRPCHQ